jgi:hypothetical protein
MNALKRFLKGEVLSIDPSIVETLKKYKSIKIDSIVYDTKEVIQRIEEAGCSHCKAYKAELESLRYQLKQLNAPKIAPIEVLLEKFIDENYVKIKEREYSRKQLFTEVNAHLRGFGLQILENTDPVWRYVIETIVGDTNRNYRKLKLKKR